MPTIAQFSTDPTLVALLDKHHAWHTTGGSHGLPGRQFASGSAGSGTEFLNFHRQFVADFLAWNAANGNPITPSSVAAWTSIPAALKATSFWNTGWQNDETTLTNNLNSFGTADALGIFIENGIHNQFLHSATAEAFSEPLLTQFHSPQSTYFYQIHGLVDLWYQQWQNLVPGPVPEQVPNSSICFIATAALGNHNHPSVILLSQFRDQWLLPRSLGRAFIRFYYVAAPFPSRIISKSVFLRWLSYRLIVKPGLHIAKYLLNKKSR